MMDLGSLADILLHAADAAAEVMRVERSKAAIAFKDLDDQPRTARTMARCMVTSADLAVQEVVLRILLDSGMLDFNIVAEESTSSVAKFQSASSSVGTLFVDPIDGTLGFAVGSSSFEGAARKAGFAADTIASVRAHRDPRMYGIVLGAEIPGLGIVSVCSLPELGIVYHAINNQAFRQRLPLKCPPAPCTSCWVISSSILDSPKGDLILSDMQGIPIRRSGSNPAALWQVLEGDCSGYVAVQKPFDGQLAAVIASAAGLLVTDKDGVPFAAKDLRGSEESLIWAFTRTELKRLSNVAALATLP
jgi:fructose-1,6-bisphosphatase/inositol monophosphatase family enzyme